MRWYLAGVAYFGLLGLLSCTTLIPVTAPTAVWDISASGVDFRGPQPTGVILLTTASIAGMINRFHGFHPYAATKFAVVGMSEGLAVELTRLIHDRVELGWQR